MHPPVKVCGSLGLGEEIGAVKGVVIEGSRINGIGSCLWQVLFEKALIFRNAKVKGLCYPIPGSAELEDLNAFV